MCNVHEIEFGFSHARNVAGKTGKQVFCTCRIDI